MFHSRSSIEKLARTTDSEASCGKRPSHSTRLGGAPLPCATAQACAVLWAGLAAVLLPLVVLLALQYWWLADLERNSAIAREATLKNYLEAITKEVHYFYWKISERALNLPPEIFGEKKTEKAALYFKKKEIEGARRLFIVSFLARESMLFYDPEKARMVVPKHSDETVAVWAAASPWSYLRKKGTKIEKTALSVDQHDPKNRIIINPITDEMLMMKDRSCCFK